jgi:branched-chain amino acid transport system substrate-binding protein
MFGQTRPNFMNPGKFADQNGEDVEKSKKGKKDVIIHDKSTSGNSLPDETTKAMNVKRVTEVLYKSINAGEKVYSAALSWTKASGVDFVCWGGLHPKAGLLVTNARSGRPSRSGLR